MAVINDLVMQVNGNNIIVRPYTVGDAVYMNEYNGYNLVQALEDLRNNAVSDWDNIRGKPFSSLSNDFRVVDNELELNVNYTSDWNSITNKPNYFNTSWSRIVEKPNAYPTDWNMIANKPNNYGSDWNNIDNKPNYFPTEWNLVENRPNNFASSWNEIDGKPFNSLDPHYFDVNDNNYLSLTNILGIISMDEYNNLSDEDKNYYMVYNYVPSGGGGGGGQGVVLPKFSGITTFSYSNTQMNTKPGEAGYVRVPVEGEVGYYPLMNWLWFNFNPAFAQYYLNEDISGLTKNYIVGYPSNIMNLRTDYVINGVNAFEGYVSSEYWFSNNLVLTNLVNGYHMFNNARIDRDQQFTFENYNNRINNVFNYYHSNNSMIFKMESGNADIQTPNLLNITVKNLIYTVGNYEESNLIFNPSISILDSTNIDNLVFEGNGAGYNASFVGIAPYGTNLTVINGFESINGINAANYAGAALWLSNINNVWGYSSSYYQKTTNNYQLYLVDINNIDLGNGSNWYGGYSSAFNMDFAMHNVKYAKLNDICYNAHIASPSLILGSGNAISLNLNGTFKQTTSDISLDVQFSPSLQKVYLNNAFYNANYINSVTLSNAVVDAIQAFASCPITKVTIANDAKQLRNLYNCFGYISTLNNIEGGGNYDSTNNIIYELDSLKDCSYLFFGTNLTNDVEFNLYATHNFKADSLFSVDAINVNKKIHILQGSSLDQRINAGNAYIMDIYGYNANNVTILENGILFNDYNLYIYNDLPAQKVIFGNLPVINNIATNVIFTGSEYFNSSSESLEDLGAWDQANNTERTRAYFNTLSNEVYLTTNNIPASKVVIPGFTDFYSSGQGLDLFNAARNMQELGFLTQITNFICIDEEQPFKLRLQSDYELINGVNYALFNLPENIKFNLDSVYRGCSNLTSVDYLDDRIINLYYAFCDCTNLQTVPQNILYFDNINLYSAFNNCSNLINGLHFTANEYDGSYMYRNCQNLIEQNIPSGFNGLMNIYGNCLNLEKVQWDIDPNKNTQFYTYSYYWCSGTFDNCRNLSSFKIALKNPMNYNNYMQYGYDYMFRNCKSLMYMPIVPGLANINIYYDITYTYYNTDNLVALQFPNLIDPNANMWGHNVQMPNTAESSSNYHKNVAIASIGNGYTLNYGYNNYNNLIMGAAAEYMAHYGGYSGVSVYNYFSDCHSLLYGRMSCPDEVHSSNLFNYYMNDWNLITTEISDDMRYRWINQTNWDILSPTTMHNSYRNCFNLAYAFIPKLFTANNSFLNCNNLAVVDITTDYNGYASFNYINNCFHDCYNLTSIYVSNGLPEITYSFNNLPNLVNVDGLSVLGAKYQAPYGDVIGGNIFLSFWNIGVEHFHWKNARYKDLYQSFWNCNNLTDIVIEDSTFTNSIFGSFFYAPNLVSVNLSNCVVGVLNICPSSPGYNNLTDIYLDVVSNRGPTWMATSFNGCPNLTNVTISVPKCLGKNPEGYGPDIYGSYDETNNMYGLMFDTQIGGSWGYNSTANIKSIKIIVNESNKFIQISRLNNLPSLTDVEFCGNGQIRQYMGGGYLFDHDTVLNNVTGTIHQLSSGGLINMFNYCIMLEEPFDNIIEHDGYAQDVYRNCWSLKNCSYLNFTTMQDTYRDCYKLTEAYCPNTATSMTNTFENCTNLRTVDIGPNVVSFNHAYKNCLNIPNNIAINSRVDGASWYPAFEYREDQSLDIHIYINSGLYNALIPCDVDYNSILLNAPELETGYSNYCNWDITNRRFFWDQPNIKLNIYYDLED